jgi:hypothetical protein
VHFSRVVGRSEEYIFSVDAKYFTHLNLVRSYHPSIENKPPRTFDVGNSHENS